VFISQKGWKASFQKIARIFYQLRWSGSNSKVDWTFQQAGSRDHHKQCPIANHVSQCILEKTECPLSFRGRRTDSPFKVIWVPHAPPAGLQNAHVQDDGESQTRGGNWFKND
jgi:hypothetical protein